MQTKVITDAATAVSGIRPGATVLVGGWGGIGVPDRLITALAARQEVTGLTIVSNNCGMGRPGDVGILFAAGLVANAITTYPTNPNAVEFRRAFDAGRVDVEVIPQGTLAERLRAAGAGLGGFYTPAGVGTPLAGRREGRVLHGREYVFEEPLPGDVALIRAQVADEAGNLRFRLAARNFNPLMAMAARHTIVQVERIVPIGALDPDDVHLPGIFVNTIVQANTTTKVEE